VDNRAAVLADTLHCCVDVLYREIGEGGCVAGAFSALVYPEPEVIGFGFPA
jgi:hypothetical protein